MLQHNKNWIQLIKVASNRLLSVNRRLTWMTDAQPQFLRAQLRAVKIWSMIKPTKPQSNKLVKRARQRLAILLKHKLSRQETEEGRLVEWLSNSTERR